MSIDPSPPAVPNHDLAFAAGGGDMGAALRAFDWAATSLGALSGWPQPLRTAVSLMLGTPQPMCVAWGADLRLLYNDACRGLLGAGAAHPGRSLGQRFEAAWPAAWDQMRPALQAALGGAAGHAGRCEFVLLRHGCPERVHAGFTMIPLRDDAGAVAGVCCMCDGTAGRAPPAAAAGSDARFRPFFEQATCFAALIALDGTLLEANDIALEAAGDAREDLVGRPFHACGWWNRSPRVMAQVAECVALAGRGETVRRELRWFRVDASERYIDMVMAPVTGSDGGLLCIAATGSDITERRQVEERLRLLDAIGEATRVALDPKTIMSEATRLLGGYLDVTRVAYADVEADNDRFTIRHDFTAPGAASSIGVYSLDLFGSRARADMREGRTLRICDVDRELLDEDGAAMFNRIGVKAIVCCPLVKEGRLVAMMAVHQEAPRAWSAGEVALVEAVVERCWAHIERVRGAEALRAADRHKSEFLATLAHELRNPLAPIRNGLEIMRMKRASPQVLDNVRAMLDRQVGHMVHLIDDLLDIARVSSGKLVLQMRPGDLREAIATAVEASKPLLDAAGHALAVGLPDAPLPALADPVRISQVVSNLLSNAAKYTPHGGRVALAARVEAAGEGMREAVITVSDNGIGLAADMLGAVFEMFTQVPRSIDRAGGGLGIGLSLVRRLVELHGGTVDASSPGVGRGSTFTVRLPLAAPAADAADGRRPHDPAPAALPAAGAGRSLRVLVADDNADAARSLAALLGLDGHRTRVVHDGVAALAVASEFRPELVFLDLGMPHMDGYEAARRMRATPGLRDALLVALTGWGAQEDRDRARAAGFDRHLLKPAVPAEVQAVLAEAMRA